VPEPGPADRVWFVVPPSGGPEFPGPPEGGTTNQTVSPGAARSETR
jgi:hypothetical protein